MAISIYQANATIDSVMIEIYGLDSNYRSKQFDVLLNGRFYGNYTDTTGSSSIIIITGLQEGTSYSCEVRAFCDHGNDNWQPDPATDQNYATITITTLGGGGGGGGNPTFGVSISGSNIYVTVFDYGSNPAVHAYLYDNLSDAVAKNNNDIADSYENDYQCMIQAPASGTYYVVCHYIDDNVSWIWLQDNYGYTQVEVTIDSGPSPSDNYSYPWSGSANVISINSIEGWRSGSAYEGWFFTFNFDSSGTLRLYSSNLNGSIQSYIGTVDRSYDPSNGRPIYYDDSATGNFDFTWNGSTGNTLYLWVNSNGNSSYSFYLNASFSGSGTAPTYTAQVVNNNQIQMTVSNRGSYYLRYFVRRSDSSSATYDSWEVDGQLATYVGLTVPNLSYNTWYTVNVGYSTIRTSGQVTWIGSMELKTDSQPVQQFQYNLESGITVSNSQPNPKRISFSENHGVIVPITISYNGVVTVYTETDQSSRMDDQAYLCTSRNVSYDSAGVVDHSSQYYIKENDQGHGNNEFQMTIDNTNVGTNVYYLYIRGYPLNNIPRAINTLLYAKTSSGYVYIYDGSTWRQAVPYIYDGSTWREAIPYVYNGSSWKECGG